MAVISAAAAFALPAFSVAAKFAAAVRPHVLQLAGRSVCEATVLEIVWAIGELRKPHRWGSSFVVLSNHMKKLSTQQRRVEENRVRSLIEGDSMDSEAQNLWKELLRMENAKARSRMPTKAVSAGRVVSLYKATGRAFAFVSAGCDRFKPPQTPPVPGDICRPSPGSCRFSSQSLPVSFPHPTSV